MRWSLSAHYGHFAQFGNGEYARIRLRRKGPDGGRGQWAYNHLSGMKSLRLMEAGRLG